MKRILLCGLALLASAVLAVDVYEMRAPAEAVPPGSAAPDTRVYPGAALDPLVDYGYCGPPKRDEHGQIIRSEAVKAAFQALIPCPSTGQRTGECPDWSMDHTRSLACGGCDSVSNLAWLHKSVKSAAGAPGFFPKDRSNARSTALIRRYQTPRTAPSSPPKGPCNETLPHRARRAGPGQRLRLPRERRI